MKTWSSPKLTKLDTVVNATKDSDKVGSQMDDVNFGTLDGKIIDDPE